MKLLGLGVVLGLLIAVGAAFTQRGAPPALAASPAPPSGEKSPLTAAEFIRYAGRTRGA